MGRDEVVSFARDSFMRGSTDPGMTALLSSGGPAELIERSALLDAAGVHRTEVVAELSVLEVKAEVADQQAQLAAQETAAVQAQAAGILARAQSHEISARSQADALAVREDAVQAELQQAQQVLSGLEGDRAAAQADAARQAAAAAARTTVQADPAPAPAPAPSRPAPSRPAPVSPPPGGAAGAPSVSKAQTAIEAARSQLGVAYSWGGGGTNGPSYGIAPDAQVFGFDCSGLTQYAYGRAGISIGGTSRDQWWLNRTKQVATADLEPGDLLFWGSDRSDYMSITHVALYMGDGKMIEAPDRGQTVMISTARTSSSTYFGAVRPSA